MNTKKYLQYLSLAGASILFVSVILLVLATVHHSDSLRLENLPPGCAKTVQEIHYPQTPARGEDCKIRNWYAEQVNNIPETLKQLPSLSEQAYCAFSLRHQLRLEARAAMPSVIEVDFLRIRDLVSYGHFDGPEFSQLTGPQPDESDYRRVIASAIRTDAQVNQFCVSP